MTNIKSIDLDIPYDNDNVFDYAKQFNCTAKLKEQYGPAGGNPLYTFSGNESDLKNLIADYDVYGDNIIDSIY